MVVQRTQVSMYLERNPNVAGALTLSGSWYLKSMNWLLKEDLSLLGRLMMTLSLRAVVKVRL